MGNPRALLWLLLPFWQPLPPAACGADVYYVLVFSSQTPHLCAKHSHTFATFVKATGAGPCAEAYALESHTISWLPATGNVQPTALLRERGRNLDLGSTLRWADATGQRVSLWGPYQIDRELYDRALAQIANLESGAVCYKALDSGCFSSRACNCIHAVSVIADGHHLLVFSPGFGDIASYRVSQCFQPWIIDPCRKHDWVASRLGLDGWPLVRRDWEPPGGGPVERTIHFLFHGHSP
jgi:hypothetical protein